MAKDKKAKPRLKNRRPQGLAMVAGVAALGIGAGVVAERVLIGRSRLRPDPYAKEPYGKLKADRSYEVATSDGGVLKVFEMGPEDAERGVVFLHGYCLDHSIWHHQMKDLDARHRKLVFFDARHHGASRGGSDSTDVRLLARDLDAVIEAAGLSRYILVGHSMGGMTVLEYCREFPERMRSHIAGIVLVNTTYTDAVKTIVAADIIGPLERRLGWFLTKVMDSPRSARVMKLRGDDFSYMLVKLFGFGSDASPAQVEHVRRLLASFPSPHLIDTLRGIRRFDYEDALEAVDVPTLIFAGGDDRITSVRASEHMADVIPGSRLVIFEDTGHTGMMERAVEFNVTLDDFIDEQIPAQSRKRA